MPRVNDVRPNAYGLNEALTEIAPVPYEVVVAPGPNDWAPIGQIVTVKNPAAGFLNVGNNANGDAVWLNLSGGSGSFSDVTIDPGNVEVLQGNVDVVAGNVDVGGLISAPLGTVSGLAGAFNTLGVIGGAIVGGIVDFDLYPNAVLVTDANGDVAGLQAANDGELLIGRSGTSPVFALPTSTGMTVDITSTGPGNLNLETTSAVGTSEFTTDAGTANPVASEIDILGGTNINTSGATNVVTINLDDSITLAGSLDAGTTLSSTTSTTVGDALTVTTGDATLSAGRIIFPNAVSATNGYISQAGDRLMHSFGTDTIFVGTNAGNFTHSGGALVAVGTNALQSATTLGGSTAIGYNAATLLETGSANLAAGSGALAACTDATNTTVMGAGAMASATQSARNTVLGYQAAADLLTGSDNTIVGGLAGSAYVGSESGNIIIGYNVTGTAAEINTTRIGLASQAACYIQGIYNRTYGGTNAAVIVDDTGKLGTIMSSARYKENIEDMGAASDPLMNLRPVVFNYKSRPKDLAYGLIAEEVDEVFPDLVNYDDEGLPASVKYHDLPSILLDQMQKLLARIDVLEVELAKRS